MKFVQGVLFLAISSQAFASDSLRIVGTMQQNVPVVSSEKTLGINTQDKMLTFIRFHLSENARARLVARVAAATQTSPATSALKGSQNKQLGMSNVPVLDQGPHGSCATFANIGAVDAALNKGDYYSALCMLELGNYLENTTYGLSGWEGEFGPNVLAKFSTFGLISKEKQKENGCGELTAYPMDNSQTPETFMTPEAYHQLSEPMSFGTFAWTPILDAYQVFVDKKDMNKTVEEVKASLNAGDRLTFGVLLPDVDKGVAGAVGKFHNNNDTWILTPEIAEHINFNEEMAGHEMIITGYDDNAVAYDNKGRLYRGLFTLRNSWGEHLGDKGNFYMSYSYFKALATEAQRIRTPLN